MSAQTPSGGSAEAGSDHGQPEREVPAAPPEGLSPEETLAQALADVKAWQENYDGMFWRWAECDTERLRLKAALADAKMRLRLWSEQCEAAQ